MPSYPAEANRSPFGLKTTESTSRSRPRSVIYLPPKTFAKRISGPSPPAAIRLPVGLIATLLTVWVGASICTKCCLKIAFLDGATSLASSWWLRDPRMMRSSELKATHSTNSFSELDGGSIVLICLPVATSQTRTVLSHPPDASKAPSGLKATDRTWSVWPLSVDCSFAGSAPRARSQENDKIARPAIADPVQKRGGFIISAPLSRLTHQRG